MIVLDGAEGEGGGQILRTALALSAHTGQPFRVHSIRKRRQRPGLARQHLTSVRAAAAICGAEVEGAALGSTELTFRPGALVPGEHRFAIGTAGSTCLVLQTVLLPLAFAKEPSLIHLEGGTHNDKAPSYDFLAAAFLPLLARMGFAAELELRRPGFYPAGGGEMVASVEPAGALRPLELLERGALGPLRATATLSGLPRSIAHRELAALTEALGMPRRAGRVQEIEDPVGPGNVLSLAAPSACLTELFTAFGRRGTSSERVAEELAAEVRAYLEAEVPVGPHLADQLLLPMALAGGGRFRTVAPDPHTPTNAAVIRRFLDRPIRVEQESERAWRVELE